MRLSHSLIPAHHVSLLQVYYVSVLYLLTLTLEDLQQSVSTQMSQPTVPKQHLIAETLSLDLPSREVADRYVENYFKNMNEIFWVLSYNEFMTWYQGYDPAKPLGPTREAILLLVLAFGSSSEKNDEREQYSSSALNLIGPVMKQGGLEGIQALLLMVHSLLWLADS